MGSPNMFKKSHETIINVPVIFLLILALAQKNLTQPGSSNSCIIQEANQGIRMYAELNLNKIITLVAKGTS